MDYTDAETRQIADAILAHERIKAGEHFEDWVSIGQAYAAVRNKAMRDAGTNTPHGPHYKRAWKAEIESETNKAWADFDPPTRSHAIWLADNIGKVMSWRRTLSKNQYESWNHPTTLWRRYNATHRNDEEKTTPARPSPMAQAKERIEDLERQNAELQRKAKQSDDAFEHFDWRSDAPEIIARILFEKFPSKAKSVASEILKLSQEKTRKSKAKAEVATS